MEFNILSVDSLMLSIVANSLHKHNIHRGRDFFEKCLSEEKRRSD